MIGVILEVGGPQKLQTDQQDEGSLKSLEGVSFSLKTWETRESEGGTFDTQEEDCLDLV